MTWLPKDSSTLEDKVVRLVWEFDCLHFAQYISIRPNGINCIRKQTGCKMICLMIRATWLNPLNTGRCQQHNLTSFVVLESISCIKFETKYLVTNKYFCPILCNHNAVIIVWEIRQSHTTNQLWVLHTGSLNVTQHLQLWPHYVVDRRFHVISLMVPYDSIFIPDGSSHKKAQHRLYVKTIAYKFAQFNTEIKWLANINDLGHIYKPNELEFVECYLIAKKTIKDSSSWDHLKI